MSGNSSMRTIAVTQHGVTKEKMDSDALKILAELNDRGYESYLVGGCIRDHISGIKPKDYDIVTKAKPKKIMQIFPKSILVGRRFPLVHVRIPGKRNKIIEVATFRTKHADKRPKNKVCRWLQQFLIFGDLVQDAQRRDLTAQALYWRAADSAILDFHEGYQHALEKKIQIIGDIKARLLEDPVRILRILRVKAKLNYSITPELQQQLQANKNLLANISASRLYGELLRSFHGGFGYRFFTLLLKYKLHNALLPAVVTNKNAEKWILLGLSHADKRYADGLSLSAGYLFAVLLWPVFNKFSNNGKRSVQKTINRVLSKQHKKTAIPKKNVIMIEHIWKLQPHLLQVKDHKDAQKLLQNNFFKAAYDFLLLRAEFAADLQPIAKAWQEYLAAKKESREQFKFVSDIEDL